MKVTQTPMIYSAPTSFVIRRLTKVAALIRNNFQDFIPATDQRNGLPLSWILHSERFLFPRIREKKTLKIFKSIRCVCESIQDRCLSELARN